MLLREGTEREALGARAQQVLMEQRGATACSVARILELAQKERT
jgi:hypothetical protein